MLQEYYIISRRANTAKSVCKLAILLTVNYNTTFRRKIYTMVFDVSEHAQAVNS